MEPESSYRRGGGIFQMLDGAPAQALVVLGLALTLFAPLVPGFKRDRVVSAQVALERAERLTEIELDDFRQAQEREAGGAQPDASGSFEDAGRRSEERDRALAAKRDEVRRRYDIPGRRRALIDAQAAAAGSFWYLVLRWIGHLLLILGLLVLTLLSEGARQKILLVVLLVVLFSALSGVNVGFQASGNLGGAARDEPADLLRDTTPGPTPRPTP